MERENRSFWDILIWVTVLTGGLFGLEGLMMKVAGNWTGIIYSLILMICSVIQLIRNRKAGEPELGILKPKQHFQTPIIVPKMPKRSLFFVLNALKKTPLV